MAVDEDEDDEEEEEEACLRFFCADAVSDLLSEAPCFAGEARRPLFALARGV